MKETITIKVDTKDVVDALGQIERVLAIVWKESQSLNLESFDARHFTNTITLMMERMLAKRYRPVDLGPLDGRTLCSIAAHCIAAVQHIDANDPWLNNTNPETVTVALEADGRIHAAEDHQFFDAIRDAGNVLANSCYAASFSAGWWSNLQTGHPFDMGEVRARVPEKLCLIHSEVSEALEGHRKNRMDDHLPHRLAIEVELADAVIRIADLAGALNLDLGGAIAEKMHYNANRADHKIENRRAVGGKSI